MQRIATVCLWLLLCSTALAQTVDVNGYTWKDGYWWKDGTAYTRYSQPYTYCGRYYNKYTYQAAPVQNTINYTQPNWRERLASFAGKIKLEAVEHQAFVESVEKLGLGNIMSPMGVPGTNPYTQLGGPGYGQPYANGYTQQSATGATSYGTDTTQYNQYGGLNPNDVMQLVQMTIRLNSDQQQLAHDGGTQVRAMVNDLGQQVTAVEEIKAKAQAAATVLGAIRPEQRTSVVRSITSAGVGAQPIAQPTQPGQPSQLQQQGANLRRLQAIFNNNCVSCHNANKAPRMDLSDATRLSPENMDLVAAKVDDPDPNVRMPRSPDGGAAPPLSPEDKRFIIFMAGPNSDSSTGATITTTTTVAP